MHLFPLLSFALAALYFAHRLYGIWFPFEGDSLKFIYFRLHPDLISADHNPYQWDSMSGFPAGEWNPLLYITRGLLSLFPLEPLARALLECALLALTTQILLCTVFYFLFYRLTKNRVGSWIGAIVVSYNGLPLIGIREFNTMYAHSLLCSCGVLWFGLKLIEEKWTLRDMSCLSICIGFSLLGGTNTPLFYFLPWLSLALLLFPKKHRIQNLAAFALAIALGFLIGSVAWLPKLGGLQELNRQSLDFWGNKPVLSFGDFITGLFFPEIVRGSQWRTQQWWNIQETSFFLGAPITWFLAAGLWQKWKTPKGRFFLFLLVAGLAVMISPHFPRWATFPLSELYSRLSVRNPNRFWMLCLPSIGYFVAEGVSFLFRTRRLGTYLGILSAMALTFIFLVLPQWGTMVPDAHPALILSSIAALLSIFSVLSFRLHFAALFVFLMYAWAPLQATSALTNYFDFLRQGFSLPASRLSLPNVLGLGADYDRQLQRASHVFLTSPPYLSDPQTKRGRIFDIPALDVQENYFAPVTGHRFFFSALTDPSTFRNVNKLATLRSDAVLGMAGVCTKLESQDNIPQVRRVVPIDCLPLAFWTHSVLQFPNVESVVEWLKTSTLNDFSKRIGILRTDGEPIPLTNTEGSAEIRFDEKPGKITVNGNATSNGYIFISTPYRKTWHAKVNGLQTKVYPANLAFLAVPVPKGDFTLTLTLEHGLKHWAMLLSGLSTLLALLANLFPTKLNLPIVRAASITS